MTVTTNERAALMASAREAGRYAGLEHARHGTIPPPGPPDLFSGSLLARQAATAWHEGFGEASDG